MVKRRNAGPAAPSHTPAWKNSPLVGAGLAVVIVICAFLIFRCFYPGGGGTMLPETYPHAYLAAADNGDESAILIKRGSRSLSTPFTENGKEYWPAYVCCNPHCPGLKDGKRFVFAAVMPPAPAAAPDRPPMGMSQPIVCPRCQEAFAKAKGNKRQNYEPSSPEPYMTDEAKKITEEIREKYRKQSGN